MRPFWKGFNSSKSSPPVRYRKHVIILYWSPEDKDGERVKTIFKRLSFKYPTVSIKTVNIKKDPLKPQRHKVLASPTIILLKDGREVERLTDKDGTVLLEHLFRKAHS